MSIETLQQYMADNGLSQNQVSAQLGVSSSTVSQYLKGKYQGDVAKVDKAVAELVARHAEKMRDVQSEFVLTPTAKRMLELCGLAHSLKDIYLLIGEAGLGKTMALTVYAKRTSNVVMLEVDPTFSVKVMLTELCALLGVTAGRNNHAMITAIIDKLKGSDKLLIVDEAELLSHKPLEVLRRIHDKSGVGMILSGMPRLRANLRGAKGEYKQLYSRVGCQLDIKNRLPERDINMMSQQALDTDAFGDKLYQVSGGNARRLNKLLRGVKRMSVINNAPVSIEMIERFAQMLID